MVVTLGKLTGEQVKAVHDMRVVVERKGEGYKVIKNMYAGGAINTVWSVGKIISEKEFKKLRFIAGESRTMVVEDGER